MAANNDWRRTYRQRGNSVREEAPASALARADRPEMDLPAAHTDHDAPDESAAVGAALPAGRGSALSDHESGLLGRQLCAMISVQPLDKKVESSSAEIGEVLVNGGQCWGPQAG